MDVEDVEEVNVGFLDGGGSLCSSLLLSLVRVC